MKKYCLALIIAVLVSGYANAALGCNLGNELSLRDDRLISINYTNTGRSKVYTDIDFHVLLKYPSNWERNPNYYVRYEGEDGFFQISAIGGRGLSIDEAAELDAYHKLEPYGPDPQINKLKIQNQEAILILPSQELKGMKKAGLIVKYPKPVLIGKETYCYLVLWASIEHIKQIAETLSFI